MATQVLPSVNDYELSWSDIAVTVTPTGGALIEMGDISGIKWARKVEVGEQRGASGGRVMKRTRGKVSYEAALTITRSSLHERFLPALVALAPRRGNQALVAAVSFEVLIQHTPLGSTKIYTTKIKGCRYLEDSDDMKEGSDPDQVEVTLNPIEIVNIINGVEALLI